MAALGRLIGGFITILVGVVLIDPIGDQVSLATSNQSNGSTNVTGASYTITGLITLFFALGVLTSGIGIAIGGLKEAGLV